MPLALPDGRNEDTDGITPALALAVSLWPRVLWP